MLTSSELLAIHAVLEVRLGTGHRLTARVWEAYETTRKETDDG